jgi:hypothetical protein
MKSLFSYIKKIFKTIPTVLLEILLLLVYFIILAPLGFVLVLFTDYLNLKSSPHWSRCNKSDYRADRFLKTQ